MRLTPVDPDLLPLDLPVVSSDDDGGDMMEDDEAEDQKVVKSHIFSAEEENDGPIDESSESSEESQDEINESINGPLLDDISEQGHENRQSSAVPTRRRTMSGWFKNKFGRKDKQKKRRG